MTSLDTEFIRIVRKLAAVRSPREVLSVLCRITADRIDPALAGRTEDRENAEKLTGDYSPVEKRNAGNVNQDVTADPTGQST